MSLDVLVRPSQGHVLVCYKDIQGHLLAFDWIQGKNCVNMIGLECPWMSLFTLACYKDTQGHLLAFDWIQGKKATI